MKFGSICQTNQRLGLKSENGFKARIFSNFSSRRNDGSFRDHNHSVANEIIVAIHIFRFPCRRDHHVVSDMGVLVNDSKNARRFLSFLLSAFRAEPLVYQFVIKESPNQRIVGRAGVCGPWNESEKKSADNEKGKSKAFHFLYKREYRRSNPRSATSKVSPEPETGSGRASPYRAWMKTLPNQFFVKPVR